jgi:hypothetical protein
MTPIDSTRPHVTQANVDSARRGARPGPRSRASLVYDGVTAAYIRDLALGSSGPGSHARNRTLGDG